mmetsp:Transcript_25590/g.28262  ORF Transcript_25590/g.28262 Transcript_25590/m.28262 type:complete len:167 (+) Transcript_25590:204-704(+)
MESSSLTTATNNTNLQSLRVSTTDCGTFQSFDSLMKVLPFYAPHLRQLDIGGYYIPESYSDSTNHSIDQQLVLLSMIKKMPTLCDIILPLQMDKKSTWFENQIHFECMLHLINEKKLLLCCNEEQPPVSLLPFILSKLNRGCWFNVMYYIIQEKNDILIRNNSKLK